MIDHSRRPVAVVQHQPFVPPGSITEVLGSRKVDHFVLEAWNPVEWPSSSELGALVVLGGSMNVDELDAYPFLKKSADLMSEALRKGVPTLGVCLGSQMMARVLGNEVREANSKNAVFSPLELTREGSLDPVMTPFKSGVPVLQFHGDTFETPDDAVLLATSSASSLTQAIRYGDSAYGVQFHFEVDKEIVESWCTQIGGDSMDLDWGISKEELLQQADRFLAGQRVAGMDMLHRFFEIGGLLEPNPSRTGS